MKRFFFSFLCCVMQLAVAGCFTSFEANAQELSFSTNIVDYASTGTANLEASYGFTRHWSISAGMKYDAGGMAKQQVYSLGGRYWPWHIYSGWWFSGKMQYQEFNDAERTTKETSEGDRYGAGIAGGYSRMLGRHINLDLGIGLWTGYTRYVTYACPTCGRIIGSGKGIFILPNDITLGLSYIF